MLFPVAGVEAPFFLPPLAALVVSFFTSMGGISGAFLLLPFQISILGYSSPGVSATNQFYNVVATPGGVWRYFREGRLLAPLAVVAILGSLPGVFIGALVRLHWLSDAQSFKIFAAAVLFYMASRMVFDLYRQMRGKNAQAGKAAQLPGTARPVVLEKNSRVVRFSFQEKIYSFNVRAVFAMTVFVGLVGGVYGIGGGAILAPFLISFFGLPVYITAGPTLLCTFITSLGGVACYVFLAPFYPHLNVSPDWLLGLSMGVGGLLGMNLGARCQKYVPARMIKVVLAGILLATAFSWVL